MPKSLLLFFLGLMSVLVVTVFMIIVLPERPDADQELADVPAVLEEPPVSFLDPIRGNPDAAVTLITYGDYTCPLCQSLEVELNALVAEAPNERRLVWKDAPNQHLHPESVPAAMAARCAQDQGSFWAYHDRLFADRITPSAQRLQNIAQELGLDMEAFDNCMASEVTRPIVDHTLQEAISLNLSGTPELFINGTRYTGALTQDAIRSAIEAL